MCKKQGQRSVGLLAGALYYIEVLHKDGLMGDYVKAEWAYPTQTETVIDGSFCIGWGSMPMWH